MPSATTDVTDPAQIARLAEGLKPWVAAAIRDANPYGVLQHVVSPYAGVPHHLTKDHTIATIGTPLNERGEAVRRYLLTTAAQEKKDVD